jgi:hypothetical protein
VDLLLGKTGETAMKISGDQAVRRNGNEKNSIARIHWFVEVIGESFVKNVGIQLPGISRTVAGSKLICECNNKIPVHVENNYKNQRKWTD